MIKLFCDNCKEEIKDLDFMFDATMRSVNKISQLVAGVIQQKPQLEERKIHLCRKCYKKKFE